MESALMKQYKDLKGRYCNCVLLFRVGDFYEAFEEDAEVLATLGHRLVETDTHKLAGFREYKLNAELTKLIKAGHRVATVTRIG